MSTGKSDFSIHFEPAAQAALDALEGRVATAVRAALRQEANRAAEGEQAFGYGVLAIRRISVQYRFDRENRVVVASSLRRIQKVTSTE